MPNLTLHAYASRKRQLERLLEHAEGRYAEAALAREEGENTLAELDEARSAVTAAQDSLAALQAAWGRSLAADAAEAKAKADRKARQTIDAVEEQLKIRLTAAKAIKEAENALAAAVKTFLDTDQRIRSIAMPPVNKKRGTHNAIDMRGFIPWSEQTAELSSKAEPFRYNYRDIVDLTEQACAQVRGLVFDLEPDHVEEEREAA